jgi:hypothetical protein
MNVILETYSPPVDEPVGLVTGMFVGVSESIANKTPVAVVATEPFEYVRLP